MTQEAVASALDVTRQAVAKWESNQVAPSTTNIMKLAELFQVRFQELLLQEDVPTVEIQKYIVKVAQAEENRKEKRKKTKKLVFSGLKISLCYLVLALICWIAFHFLGVPDHVWSWAINHCIFPLAYLYSLAGCLLYREKLGYYTFIGTGVGLILGNVVGSVTEKNTELHFNNGWIALLVCIGVFSLCGIIVSFVKRRTGSESDWLTLSNKIKRIAIVVLSSFLALYIIFVVGASVSRISFQRGAITGYNAGFSQGLHDKENGLPSDSSSSSSSIPDGYRFGSSKYNGYMIYWPTGYQAGYAEGR